jgi:SAM-dependent methyltransferase
MECGAFLRKSPDEQVVRGRTFLGSSARSRRALRALHRRISSPLAWLRTERDSDERAHKAAASYWSSSAVPRGSGSNWWEHEAIVRYVNRRICGYPLAGIMAGDVALLKYLLGNTIAERGVSVGCGAAAKEMILLRRGIVGHFDLYEISEARIKQATSAAAKWGLEGRITWHNYPADFDSPGSRGYDLVYWNNALHHMLDTRQALEWSRSVLKPEGLLYLNDFVGPDRMQWPDEMLRAATRVREALPPHLLELPRGKRVPTTVTRVDPRDIIANDPTECADSSAIVPAIHELFPGATVRPTGGVVYHLALHGILERITPSEGEKLFDLLLLIDQLHSKAGMTHYAVAYNR